MSLKEALVAEIAIVDRELGEAKEKVKNLRKRLNHLYELLDNTDKPEEESHD